VIAGECLIKLYIKEVWQKVFLRRLDLFAICNNTFSKWWESVKDGL
jgi:hypothetical protein